MCRSAQGAFYGMACETLGIGLLAPIRALWVSACVLGGAGTLGKGMCVLGGAGTLGERMCVLGGGVLGIVVTINITSCSIIP